MSVCTASWTSNLLDHSLVLCARHLAYPARTVTTANLLLSILNMFGVQQENIGDSTGYLTGLV